MTTEEKTKPQQDYLDSIASFVAEREYGKPARECAPACQVRVDGHRRRHPRGESRAPECGTSRAG